MAEISYRRHRFPPVVIQHAVWLYLRFTLSYRDVEELFAERGGLRAECRSAATAFRCRHAL
jgi:transposase-like protein